MNKFNFSIFYISLVALISGCYQEEVLIQPKGKIQYSTTKDYVFIIEYKSNYYYNNQEQLVKIENDLPNKSNSFFFYDYDNHGNMMKETLQTPTGLIKTTSYEYNEIGQITTSRSSSGVDCIYTYDEKGRLSDIKDKLNEKNHRSFSYDSMDRIEHERKYEHYDSGTLLIYDLEYRYDEDGRLVEKHLIDGDFFRYDVGPWEQFEYNADGQKIRYIKFNREWHYHELYLVEQKVDYHWQ